MPTLFLPGLLLFSLRNKYKHLRFSFSFFFLFQSFSLALAFPPPHPPTTTKKVTWMTNNSIAGRLSLTIFRILSDLLRGKPLDASPLMRLLSHIDKKNGRFFNVFFSEESRIIKFYVEGGGRESNDVRVSASSLQPIFFYVSLQLHLIRRNISIGL